MKEENKKIEKAFNSLCQKYPELMENGDTLFFCKRGNTEKIFELSKNGDCIFYDEKYLHYVSSKRIEKEISHLLLHQLLCHTENMDGYMDVPLRDALMDLQVAWFLNLMGMLKKEEKEKLQQILDEFCGGVCDFRLYHTLGKENSIRKNFLSEAKIFCIDHHEEWMKYC